MFKAEFELSAHYSVMLSQETAQQRVNLNIHMAGRPLEFYGSIIEFLGGWRQIGSTCR
jgi:hypothetical protein